MQRLKVDLAKAIEKYPTYLFAWDEGEDTLDLEIDERKYTITVSDYPGLNIASIRH